MTREQVLDRLADDAAHGGGRDADPVRRDYEMAGLPACGPPGDGRRDMAREYAVDRIVDELVAAGART